MRRISTKALGRIADAIGTHMHQGQAFEYLTGFDKRVLGGAKEREPFVQTITAAAGGKLELGIKRSKAMLPGRTGVVGAQWKLDQSWWRPWRSEGAARKPAVRLVTNTSNDAAECVLGFKRAALVQ